MSYRQPDFDWDLVISKSKRVRFWNEFRMTIYKIIENEQNK